MSVATTRTCSLLRRFWLNIDEKVTQSGLKLSLKVSYTYLNNAKTFNELHMQSGLKHSMKRQRDWHYITLFMYGLLKVIHSSQFCLLDAEIESQYKLKYLYVLIGTQSTAGNQTTTMLMNTVDAVSIDLYNISDYVQLRFIQLDHRGGYCDCWSLSNFYIYHLGCKKDIK